METFLTGFLETRPRTNFEVRQKRTTLLLFSVITCLLSFTLGMLNALGGAWLHAVSLYVLTALCIPLFIIIRRGKYYSASALLTLITLLTVNVNLLIAGSIRDSGVVAYPIIIVASTFLLGRRSAPFTVLLSMLSVWAIFHLTSGGNPHPEMDMHGLYMEFSTVLALLLCSGLLVWVILRNDEANLSMVTSSREELRASYDQTLESWAKVLEYRDRDTEGHCQRVRVLSEWLARRLGVPEQEVRDIGYGALLHDIGKLAIPDSILLKEDMLEPGELDIIKKHTDYAREMLSQIPFLEGSVCVPYSHHERWDGSGYPQGLKGEEIPLMARIFTVIDQWEALTSDRPYRKAWTHERALEYLEENRGKIFDPRVVDTFLEGYRAGELPEIADERSMMSRN